MLQPEASVKNQKVFITLRGFTALAARYNYVCDNLENLQPTSSTENRTFWRARKTELELVIDTLSLPIEKRM
jgi:hypothetical protein